MGDMKKGVLLGGGAFGVLFIGVFGLVLVGSGCSTCASISGSHQREAESQARAWTEEIGMKVKAITCAGTDSDGDGYVSCTIVEDLGDKGTKMHSMECAGAYNLNQGCRVPKLQIRQPTSGE